MRMSSERLVRTLTDLSGLAKPVFDQLSLDRTGVTERRETAMARVSGALAAVAQAVLESETAMSEVAGMSYLHDNGFAKLVLGRTTLDVAEIRVHMWGDAAGVPAHYEWDGNIHDHSADFASLLLAGSMEEEVFDAYTGSLMGSTVEVDEYTCGSRQDGNQYAMQLVGPAILQQRALISLSRGTWHGLRHNVLHRIRSTSSQTMTLFLQGQRRQTGTRAFSPRGRHWPAIVPSPPLSIDEARALVRRMLALSEEVSA